MSRNMAPATISSPDHLIEYRVEDAEPVAPSSAKGFVERMIHSEIYKHHPDVHAVIHSHSEAVVPYTISGVPLKPCYHMAGFLGAAGCSVFDASDHLKAGDLPDMLVRNEHLGAALAALFVNNAPVVLMRGHGFTVAADSIEKAVLRAVYTQKNAAIQTTSLTLRAAYLGTGHEADNSTLGIRYLSEEEAEASAEMTKWSVERPWNLWVKQVEDCSLYIRSG
ncbi:class II aldolase and Adducin domain-containing protein [Thozetella sp. PMI_491]|nr:class II aldolase and Adducin domain-containing protein [Thozetella sp. PMI_491]